MVLKKKVSSTQNPNRTRLIQLPKQLDLNQPPTDFKQYTTLIYGAKGIGKTTASASFPDNLNIMYEPRRRNVELRMYPMEHLPARLIKERKEADDTYMDAWETLVEIVFLAINDPTVQTLTIDSVDLCYESCQEHICYVHDIKNPSDKKDYGATWNEIKFAFTALFNAFTASNKTLLFISHAKEREQELQEMTDGLSMVGPSCSSSCAKIMKQMCDFWFYYGYHEGKRSLIIRDPDRSVEVACGIGFMTSTGEQLQRITIPTDPSKFYSTINKAFTNKVTGAPVKKMMKKVSIPK